MAKKSDTKPLSLDTCLAVTYHQDGRQPVPMWIVKRNDDGTVNVARTPGDTATLCGACLSEEKGHGLLTPREVSDEELEQAQKASGAAVQRQQGNAELAAANEAAQARIKELEAQLAAATAK